jgi:hypothetical protein
MKIRSAFLELFHAYGRTDGRSDFNRRSAGMRVLFVVAVVSCTLKERVQLLGSWGMDTHPGPRNSLPRTDRNGQAGCSCLLGL